MTNDSFAHFSAHPETGWLLLNGEELPLQHKAQEVLALLISRAPARVSRQELIDTIWAGNYLTGDKGLTQAIWAIRLALGDDASAPQCVRTIPRSGYQWMGGRITPDGPAYLAAPSQAATSHGSFAALGVAAVLMAVTALGWTPRHSATDSARVANAAVQNNTIVVDYTTGCKAVLIPDRHDLLVGSPIISADRKQVMFRLQKKSDCRMVTFESASKTVRKFDRCPDVRT